MKTLPHLTALQLCKYLLTYIYVVVSVAIIYTEYYVYIYLSWHIGKRCNFVIKLLSLHFALNLRKARAQIFVYNLMAHLCGDPGPSDSSDGFDGSVRRWGAGEGGDTNPTPSTRC